MENSIPAQALPLINLIRSEYGYMVPQALPISYEKVVGNPFLKVNYRQIFYRTFTPLGLLSGTKRPDACCIDHFQESFLRSNPEINQDSVEAFMKWWDSLEDSKEAADLLFGRNIQ